MKRFDGALLLVSLPDGPMPGTKAHLLAAAKAGIPRIIGCLNKANLVTDSDLIERVGMECAELVHACGFDASQYTEAVISARTGQGLEALADDLSEKTRLPADGSEAVPRCAGCGASQPAELDTCPSCGKHREKSFWQRLFG